jgi:Uma2 family endonuclease
LAIEILSSSNTESEMRHKRDDYFRAGVRQVWEIDPIQRQLFVFTAPEQPDQILSQVDILENVPGMPGFRLILRDLFSELDRHGPA